MPKIMELLPRTMLRTLLVLLLLHSVLLLLLLVLLLLLLVLLLLLLVLLLLFNALPPSTIAVLYRQEGSVTDHSTSSMYALFRACCSAVSKPIRGHVGQCAAAWSQMTLA